MSAGEAFEDLVRITAKLRGPDGCPWDREQTHMSIKPNLIEEAFEVAEAIEDQDDRELCTELGDLLLQIVFHAQMASEEERFTIVDVARTIKEKLVRRHPHVFGDTKVSGAAEALENWSKIKAAERKHKEDRSALAGVPRSMPALLRAQRLGEKASHVGFDWEDAAGVLAKLREELGELETAIETGQREAAERELGDLLYAATSLARHLDANAEDALNRAADRFSRRFRYMEERAAEQGRDFRAMPLPEKEQLWEEAKARA
jgi:tetrapyrrole methylase family protein/MazG family protein